MKHLVFVFCVVLVGCGGTTYQNAYDNAPGTVQEKHDAAKEYCLTNPCVWG